VATDGRPFWESAGLAAVVGDGVVLLTDRAHAGGLSPDWAPAVARAARAGFDASGRFRRGLDWADGGGVPVGGSGLLPADLADGTYWESAAPADVVWTVRPSAAMLLGGVVAVVGLALTWAGRSWPARRQWVGLVAWLGLAAAAVIWLPDPLGAAARGPLAAALLAAGWKLLPARPQPMARGVATQRSSAARVLTAGLVLAAWLGGGGRAAAPAPAVVYLVPGPTGGDPQAVLAPPDVLDRLRTLARRGPAGLDGAAWLDARYDGTVVGGQARFTAVLRLHSFADDPPPLPLPLTGVQLREAKLDGAPAFLRAAGDRYLVPVRGRGPHTLEVAFAAPCPAAGDDRELRFGVPEVPTSHLALTGPAGATRLQALSWRGAQRVDEDGGRPRLDADLGRVGAVHVRWRVEGRTPRAAAVRTQETYLWDLTESAARLLGSVRYTIGPGTVTALTIELPKDLEVAAVAARPLDSPAGGAVTGWLRGWRVGPPAAGGRRPLVLDFAAPVGGAWQVNLELVPRAPFPAAFALPFPGAVGPQAVPPVFAWRAQGVELTDTRPAVAVALTPESFLKDHWQPARVEADPRPPTAAYQRSAPGAAPVVRVRTAAGYPLAGRPRERATSAVAWRVGPRRAEVEAAARVSVPGGRVSLVEWDVPTTVTVTEVHGPDVHAWSRAGKRLQVWLARPTAEAAVQWSGSVARPAGPGRFDVPLIRPRAVLTGGTLRVTARDGLALAPVLSTNLTETAPPSAGGREWAYAVAGPQPYKAAFRVRPAAGGADFRLNTEATVRDRRLVATTTVTAQVHGGELQSFTVTARRGAGWDFQIAAPTATIRETAAGPEVRSWMIDLPPGVTADYRVALTAGRPLDTPADVALPDVTVGDTRPGQVQRTVAVAGPGLRWGDAVGLRPVRGQAAWQVTADDWRLRLSAAPPRPVGGAAVRAELADVETGRGDDGRWVRRATVWLVQSAAADLRAAWPAPVRVLAVELDGRSLPPPGDPAAAVAVPLPAAAGVRKLQLVWAGDADDPRPAGPEIPALTADGESVAAGPVLWTVLAPTGIELGPDAAPLPAGAAALVRAAAQVRLADAARVAGPALAEAAKAARARAAAELRRADAGLAGTGELPAGPGGITLTAWRKQLRDALRPAGPVSAAADEADELPYDDAFTRGSPSAWSVPAGDDGPRLAWPAASPQWPGRLLRTAAVVGLGVFGVWWGRRLGSAAWPEQLALLGVAAWVADGGVVWLVPAAAGVTGRLVLLAQAAVGRWWPAPAGQPPATPRRGEVG
jgi:hypothetical protein